MSNNEAFHRGRIQAQGGGTEKSVAWVQSEPLTRSQGQQLLLQLDAQLTRTERELRAEGINQVRDYIDMVAAAGGVDAPVSRTFPRKLKDGSDVRLDIEVIRGKAFVSDPEDDEV